MQIKPVDTFGDLTMRKLLPALYYRFRDKQFDDRCRIIGTARSALSDEEFRRRAADALEHHVPKEDRDRTVLKQFLALLHYAQGDATKTPCASGGAIVGDQGGMSMIGGMSFTSDASGNLTIKGLSSSATLASAKYINIHEAAALAVVPLCADLTVAPK